MLIRVTIILVLFLLVAKASDEYRNSVKSKVDAEQPEVRLATEETESLANFEKAVVVFKIGDERRSQAIFRLAAFQMQRLRLEDAERMYRLILVESPSRDKQSSMREQALLGLAQTLTLQNKPGEAAKLYTQLLDDDKRFSPSDINRIARDLSNLGLNSYLIASTQERGAERTESLQKAVGYFKEALAVNAKAPSNEKALQARSVMLSNEYLALRDLNEFRSADLVKHQALAITTQNNNPYRLP